VRKLDTPLDKMMRRSSGRRSTSKTDRKRGRYIQARPSPGNPKDLAFDATLRAAAPFQNQRKQEELHGPALRVKRHDYQKKVRVRKSANLIVAGIASKSAMAVAERMAATKGAIMSLLTDAYQRRDRVGLIVFRRIRRDWCCRRPTRWNWRRKHCVIFPWAARRRSRPASR